MVEKHSPSRRRYWRKLHIGIDAKSGEIVTVELTKKEVDDAGLAGVLINQILTLLHPSLLTAPTIRMSLQGRCPICYESRDHRATTLDGSACDRRNGSDTARQHI